MTRAAQKVPNVVLHVLVNIKEADLQANFTKMGNRGLNRGTLAVNNTGKDIYKEE